MFNAIENDDLTSVQTVCHKVKNINEVDAAGFNVLTRAVKKGNVDIIKIYKRTKKRRQSTLNNLHPLLGWGVLHHAVTVGQNKTVLATLIEQGAEVDLKDGKGNTVFNYLNRSQKYESQQKKELIDYFIKEYILASSSKPSSIQNDKELSEQWDSIKKVIGVEKYLLETILSTKEKDNKKSISLNYDTCNLIYKYLSYSDKENLCEAARLSNLNKEKHSQDEFKKEKTAANYTNALFKRENTVFT